MAQGHRLCICSRQEPQAGKNGLDLQLPGRQIERAGLEGTDLSPGCYRPLFPRPPGTVSSHLQCWWQGVNAASRAYSDSPEGVVRIKQERALKDKVPLILNGLLFA